MEDSDEPLPTPPQPPRSLVAGSSGNSREDCWTEVATVALIDAWGDRYVGLNRGNLKQKHWQEVADYVNSRSSDGKRKTDVQCKNRIDTLKKKYKLEKSRMAASTNGYTSTWHLFSRIDDLIGPAKKPGFSGAVVVDRAPSPNFRPQNPNASSNPTSFGFAVKAVTDKRSQRRRRRTIRQVMEEDDNRRRLLLPFDGGDSCFGANSSKSRESTESCRDGGGVGGADGVLVGMKRRSVSSSSDGFGIGLRELAMAIMRFGEVYEKLENLKIRQMVELEKERLEFVKEVEAQRMKLYVDVQVQMAKAKRGRQSDGG